MAGPQVTDADLVEAFIGRADRYTHSGLKLRDCFPRTAFDLAAALISARPVWPSRNFVPVDQRRVILERRNGRVVVNEGTAEWL